MITTTTPIRKARAADVSRVATTLARAFHDDPVFRWTYPDEARRRDVLPGFFSLFAEVLQRHDESYLAGNGSGAALWVPPGRAPVPDEQAEDLDRRLTELSGVDAERVSAIMTLVDEHHPHGSYHFLFFLGVDPVSQGGGLGSALLAQMLERCDREGAVAYLDATSPHNKRLYERHGFRADDPYAPDGGPPLWPMWREPAA